MSDPFVSLFLALTALAYVGAVIALAVGLRTNQQRALRLILFILAGLLLPPILFAAVAVVYYAGGGH